MTWVLLVGVYVAVCATQIWASVPLWRARAQFRAAEADAVAARDELTRIRGEIARVRCDLTLIRLHEVDAQAKAMRSDLGGAR